MLNCLLENSFYKLIWTHDVSKCYEHNENKKNVKLLKLWAIIQYHYAVDSQGELKLTQGKKNPLISVFQEKFLKKFFLFNMWNYLEKHNMVK